ncbi:sec-independent protein translocase protein TatB [Candidatus Kryptobacter tengchongensis]|uniref:Sec-independent protein translocase protein TatA n=1 Tax=Kryptobacter tengchongensis TaxID=1643429 RepID=A0A656D7D2_KRYT1|nr:twin-arginine translocase TatA/TatE family subunit [Candidatus Kryptobacter tengchongensis]CUS85810.1 sec-independent protein translocase protein TatB [Candidatus Kryptobacter tengchongensis]CUT00265.1 sec-independent protein translocase protein TatB [Candidatus Kryptobacter tengchongensis]CUU10642.1 sec-independent protein translocase protein TatB [Candidatus Kryptobacter tengchongensis]
MFDNIGFGELLVIALFILIFFGPKKIPDIARSLGKAVREFKKAMQDVQSEIQSVTGIDLNSDLNLTSPQSEVKSVNETTIDDLKFVKDAQPAETNQIASIETAKNDRDKIYPKKKDRRTSRKKKSGIRMKTKSKRR